MDKNKDCVMKIRVPNNLLKKIKRYSQEEYTTMTEIIRRSIVREIKNWEKRKLKLTRVNKNGIR